MPVIFLSVMLLGLPHRPTTEDVRSKFVTDNASFAMLLFSGGFAWNWVGNQRGISGLPSQRTQLLTEGLL